jgi:hypothetical protein
MRLAKTYTPERVENAAKRALAFGAISYRSVLSILEKNLDLTTVSEQIAHAPLIHDNLRGAAYYSGEVN